MKRGMKVGRLTLISRCRVGDRPAWYCHCECGGRTRVRQKSLANKETRSCGCLRRERSARWAASLNRNRGGELSTQFKHGEATGGITSPEYNSYRGAKSRCNTPTNAKYPRYGGRGIEFRFGSFDEFLSAVGRRPVSNYSLDRINNDGHYEPGNVRWADALTQGRNK